MKLQGRILIINIRADMPEDPNETSNGMVRSESSLLDIRQNILGHLFSLSFKISIVNITWRS